MTTRQILILGAVAFALGVFAVLALGEPLIDATGGDVLIDANPFPQAAPGLSPPPAQPSPIRVRLLGLPKLLAQWQAAGVDVDQVVWTFRSADDVVYELPAAKTATSGRWEYRRVCGPNGCTLVPTWVQE